jgi:photosystem II stability/assembly factor-like uncharacterized protein
MKKKFLLISFMLLNSLLFPQHKWEKLNGPPGGLMGNMDVNGDTLYVSGSYKIYYSTEKGKNWKQYYISFPMIDIKVIGNLTYAATQYEGIYKSRDLINWQKLNYSTSCYTLGKDYSGNLYAGSEDGKLYRSSDEGNSWILEFSDIQKHPIYKIYISKNNSVFAGTREKLFIKRQNSSVWEETIFPRYFDIHSITEDDINNIYLGDYSYVKRSTDDGLTWENMDTNGFLINNSINEFIFNTRIIGAFLDETGFFSNGWGAAVSDDRGITWRWSQTGLPPKITGQRLAKSGADTYLTTWGAGVFKSTDYGDSWFAVNNGINAATLWDILFDKDGTLYSSAWNNGLAKSTDNGESWKMINNGLTNVYCYGIISDDETGVLLSGTEQGIFRSTDKGENWIKVSSLYSYHFRKDIKNRIYSMTPGSGLYRTTDLGLTWVRIDKNFISSKIFAFAADQQLNLYAGCWGGVIYKSIDDGLNWMKVYQSSNSSTFIEQFDISSNGSIFAASNKEGILRSTDQGESWSLVKPDAGYIYPVYPVAVDKVGNVYTSSSIGKILLSKDDGDSWSDITYNAQSLSVRDFLFEGNYIYLATDESVWKGNMDWFTDVRDNETVPTEYFLSQNYPNPFNPTTTINYSLPQAGRVTLGIYDLLGREVITLMDEEKPAGEYETKWNAENYPSGVYFLKMQAGQFTQTRKLILAK